MYHSDGSDFSPETLQAFSYRSALIFHLFLMRLGTAASCLARGPGFAGPESQKTGGAARLSAVEWDFTPTRIDSTMRLRRLR